jgi:hypothetical protein
MTSAQSNGSNKQTSMDSDQKRDVGGRPTVEVSPSMVQKYAEIGCTQKEMASLFSVSPRTLGRYLTKPEFRMAKERGDAHVNVSLRKKQLELALKGDRTMLIWLGKQRLGQSERPEKDEAGAGESERVQITYVTAPKRDD